MRAVNLPATFAKGIPTSSIMPGPIKEKSSVVQSAEKKRKAGEESSDTAVKKLTTNPPVVDLASDDEEEDSFSDGDTVSTGPAVTTHSRGLNAKRQHSGGPKKKSAVWKF